MNGESHFGRLSKLDEFLRNPQVSIHSGPVPVTSRNSNGENQETKKDSYQNEPHYEVGVSLSQSPQEFSAHQTSYNYNPKKRR